MSSPIGDVTGASAGYAVGGATSSVDRPGQFGQDTFLKLLVAQLKYQSPDNPTDPSQMMSQTATFQQVQSTNQMATEMASLLASQQTTTAGELVGKQVDYTDTTGTKQTGTITSVALGGSSLVATINGHQVDAGRITSVSQPSATSTPSA